MLLKTTCFSTGFDESPWAIGGQAGNSRRQREKNVGIPSAIQPQGLIELQVAPAHVHARGMHTEQLPGQLLVGGRPAHHHWPSPHQSDGRNMDSILRCGVAEIPGTPSG